MKRTPLKAVGSRTKRKKQARQALVQRVLDRDNYQCQFWFAAYDSPDWLPGDLVGVSRVCVGPLDVHEIIPRSVWPDGELVESNCITLCRVSHHAWVTDHPAEAHRLHLHGFSWDRGAR